MSGHVKPQIALVVLLLAAPAAHAWGPTGHRIVGEIAEARLCDGARELVGPLLAGATLANAGVWADAIREEPEWRHTRRWHYINVEDAESLAAARRRSPDNVLDAIARAEAQLADGRLPAARRAEALRFLVHFVADVHQPLHVGREDDRGGNDVPVQAGRRVRSLHQVWDAEALLQAEEAGYREQALRIGAAADRTFGPGAAVGSAEAPEEWAEESRALRGAVYRLGPEDEEGVRTLPPGYLEQARAIVERRLGLAGLRLAARLNALGCPPEGSPVGGGP